VATAVATLVTGCSTSSTTVTLRGARPGQVSAVVGVAWVAFADRLEARIISGTGRSIDLHPY
jgi:hypothetical protein